MSASLAGRRRRPRRPAADRPPRFLLDGATALGPGAFGLDRDALGARIALAQQRVAVARAGPPLDDRRGSARSGAEALDSGVARSRRGARARGRCRARRASAARAATSSRPRALLPSADAMAGQYIEPMLATRPSASRTDATAGLAARLPSLCAVCRSWGRRGVCTAARDRFARQCRAASDAPCRWRPAWRCAAPASSTRRPSTPPSPASTIGAPWDRLITAFKFHGALELAPFFAVDARCRSERRRAAAPTLVVPVPLAARRLRERGYNQAWELARRVARELGITAEAQLLLRLRETAHQLDLLPDVARGQRARRLRGRAAPSRRGRRPARSRSSTTS